MPKLAEVVPERPRATGITEPQNLKSVEKCVVCCGGQQEMYRCSACHSGVYCSKACQKKEWKGHKDLCVVIQQLEAHLKEVGVRSELLKDEREGEVCFSIGVEVVRNENCEAHWEEVYSKMFAQ